MTDYDVKYAWRVTPLLSLASLLVLYTEAMLIPSLPYIQREFNITQADVSWILTAYLITGTICALIFGTLGDMYGKKKLLLTALSLYTLALILNGYAPTFRALLLSRAVQGVGMAMLPLAYSLVREQFPRRLAPMAQGLISAMNGVGIIIAFPVGAWIAQNYGWRTTFHTVAPFAILLVVLIALYVRESKFIQHDKRIDLAGIALFAIFLVSFLIALSKGPQWGWTSEKVIFLIMFSVISLFAFLFHEAKTEHPFIPREIFNRNVKAAVFATFVVAFAFQINSLTLTYLLQMPKPHGYGLPVFKAGLYMTPLVLTYLVTAPIAGRVILRVGAKTLSVFGILTAVLGYSLAVLHLYDGVMYVLGFMSVGSMGMALLNVSLINLLTFSAPRERLGLTTALFTTFRNIGSSIAPPVGGVILTIYRADTVPSPTAYYVNFSIVIAMFLIVLIPIFFAEEVLKD
ncbi:MFS transporter [Thermococcus sp. M39]|uniref:MFS transporter n=1 Tax=unclassified Thermococcus TaxID=2627626 RepID=UPI00143A5DBF|nr:MULTISPECIES: MFS transporter [unclassified Thermococcus]NJE08370.1 MFS transporter [Thermococcus sp. M39]NJE11862.1 MFS transporter [Thermococcus sp. LS2]